VGQSMECCSVLCCSYLCADSDSIHRPGDNHVEANETKIKMANEPVDLIPVPSGLSAYLLLIPLRGQEECRKRAVIGHWGR
jgi:hypothetical protein